MGEWMSTGKTKREPKKKPPKVRSYVRPTKIHTPKPRKKPKYPDKELEEGYSSRPEDTRTRLFEGDPQPTHERAPSGIDCA